MSRRQRKMNRRDLISLMTLFAGTSLLDSPAGWFASSFLDGLLGKAYADAEGLKPRRYLNIQQPGAPSRWTWDLFLTPYSNTGFQSNTTIGTRYAGSSVYNDTAYETVSVKGINAPWLWQFNIPKSGGGTRPMTDLLNHMFVMQGIATNTPSHPGAQSFHFRPTGANQSLGALSPDANNDFAIAAINAGATNYSFVSREGRSVTVLNTSGNWIEKLLTPFQIPSSANADKFQANQIVVQSAMDLATAALDDYAVKDSAISDSLAQNRKGALKLFTDRFADLTTFWNTRLSVYKDLIQRVMTGPALEGINDKPIGITPSSRDRTYQMRDGIAKGSDLRAGILPTSTVGRLAESFTLAEYVLINDISRSLTVRLDGMQGLSSSVFASNNLFQDEHEAGKMCILVLNSMYYRSLSACLLELIDQLKNRASGEIWTDTVIDVGGEFNRNARTNGFGSEHGFMGKSVNIMSGAITNGPLIIGNIKNDVKNFAGTWGLGAPTIDGKQLTLGQMAATIAHIIGVPSPVTSAKTVATLGGNQIQPLDPSYRTKIIT